MIIGKSVDPSFHPVVQKLSEKYLAYLAKYGLINPDSHFNHVSRTLAATVQSNLELAVDYESLRTVASARAKLALFSFHQYYFLLEKYPEFRTVEFSVEEGLYGDTTHLPDYIASANTYFLRKCGIH